CTIGAREAFANVQHRLVLHTFALRIEVITTTDLRCSDHADTQQLLQTRANLVASRHLIQQAACPCVLLLDEPLRSRIVRVFEIAKRIANGDRMHRLFDDLLLQNWRLDQTRHQFHSLSLTSSLRCPESHIYTPCSSRRPAML